MLVELVWRSLSTGKLGVIALVWAISFGMLAIAYTRTKRWDQTWKERWEQRHGTSLNVLRSKIRLTLKVTLALRWIVLAVFFISVGFGLGPIVTATQGLHQEPALIIIGFLALDLLLLLFVALVAGGVKLLRYRLRRIDELLAAGSQRV